MLNLQFPTLHKAAIGIQRACDKTTMSDLHLMPYSRFSAEDSSLHWLCTIKARTAFAQGKFVLGKPDRFGYTAAFGEDETLQKQLSPITHTPKGKDIPPFLILHVADRPDSTAQSQAFAKALADAGVQAEVVPGEGKTHGTINRDLGLSNDKPTKAVFEFLNGLLKSN